MNLDLRLKKSLNAVFNFKKADINDPRVIAAIITAASKVAKCTCDLITEEATVEQLLDVYKKSDDPNVVSLIGMGPKYVNGIIGYKVDFNNNDSLLLDYRRNLVGYNNLYLTIVQRMQMIEKNNVMKK